MIELDQFYTQREVWHLFKRKYVVGLPSQCLQCKYNYFQPPAPSHQLHNRMYIFALSRRLNVYKYNKQTNIHKFVHNTMT